MILARLGVLLGAVVVAIAGNAARAAPVLEPLDHAVCRLIDAAARAADLPEGFMTRVIWRESSFRAAAVSPAGAEGIAQFMPATAGKRGLRNPFDPQQAIPKAARLLAELRARFGNLGLAAAAYNAGPARVARWLAGQGDLPAETLNYVRFVTQRDAEAWIGSGSGMPDGNAVRSSALDQSCLAAIAALRRDDGGALAEVPLAPWGVQIAGNFSKAVAFRESRDDAQRYAAVIGERRPMVIGRVVPALGRRIYFQVRLPAATRAAANRLCDRILAVGGACVALRN
ncbi:MAG TPA: lytic transglycosylase domain-containing protein [Stellaceae bacterium]|nr:lytic transglycosylase domain-containing protein [Stellaceae bacterium]